MHGKVSEIKHDARGIFKSIPQAFRSTCYHSLCITHHSSCMSRHPCHHGLLGRHHGRSPPKIHRRVSPIPPREQHGDTLLKNLLQLQGGTWEENPDCGVLDATLPPFPIEALKVNAELEMNKPKAQTILEKIYAQRLPGKVHPGNHSGGSIHSSLNASYTSSYSPRPATSLASVLHFFQRRYCLIGLSTRPSPPLCLIRCIRHLRPH